MSELKKMFPGLSDEQLEKIAIILAKAVVYGATHDILDSDSDDKLLKKVLK